MKRQIKNQINNFFTIMIFCTAIFTPFLRGITEKDRTISRVENRMLAELPPLPTTSDAIRKFPQAFDNYYADHFGFREKLTRYYKSIKYYIGDSPSKHVTIGKNGWLFLGDIKNGYRNYGDPMGDVRNVNCYTQTDLKKITRYMMQLKAWLNRQGIKYLFLIAPNKHTIYFDQLPNYISKPNNRSVTDQLMEHLRRHTDLSIVDLREDLRKEKNKYQLFYKTDTHWNHYGANLAQYKIMREIEKLFPGQITPEMFELKVGKKGGGDLARFMSVQIFEELDPQPIFKEGCTPVKKTEVSNSKKREFTFECKNQKLKAVIFRDSFFTALIPYFARKFHRSTYIGKKLNYPSLTKYLDKEKPDIVIEEWVERDLPYIPEEIPELNILYTKNQDK